MHVKNDVACFCSSIENDSSSSSSSSSIVVVVRKGIEVKHFLSHLEITVEARQHVQQSLSEYEFSYRKE